MDYTQLTDEDRKAAVEAAMLAVERDHYARTLDRERVAAGAGDCTEVDEQLVALETRHDDLATELATFDQPAQTGKRTARK